MACCCLPTLPCPLVQPLPPLYQLLLLLRGLQVSVLQRLHVRAEAAVGRQRVRHTHPAVVRL